MSERSQALCVHLTLAAAIFECVYSTGDLFLELLALIYVGLTDQYDPDGETSSYDWKRLRLTTNENLLSYAFGTSVEEIIRCRPHSNASRHALLVFDATPSRLSAYNLNASGFPLIKKRVSSERIYGCASCRADALYPFLSGACRLSRGALRPFSRVIPRDRRSRRSRRYM